MKLSSPILCAMLVFAGMSPLHAQDNATTDEAAQTEDGSGATGLDTGEPVNEGQSGESASYVRETIGDWDIQCLRAEDGNDPCQMYQLLNDGQGNNVAEVSIFKVEGGGQVKAGGTFVVPLETLLTQKLTIAVDGGSAKRYDFSFCTRAGCYARVGFTDDDLARFRAGATAKITIVPALAPDQKVSVDMSLTGFTNSFGQVTSVRN